MGGCMNFSFLPDKIKRELVGSGADGTPISIARSGASLEGKPGEGYIVAYEDSVFIFSRELGKPTYTSISADMGDIGKIDVKKDGINTFLDINICNHNYSMKFSSFEEQNLKLVADLWTRNSEKTVSPEDSSVQNSAGEGLSPLTGLAAAMMYIASVDDDISKEEDYYIIAVLGNNKKLLTAGLSYYKSHTFDELVSDLAGISNEQKLCFLANMMELGMKDGVLHSSELKLMRKFTDFMKIEEDQYNTIKQVLLIKNKISTLST
jgi:hypothetical protein